MRKNNITNDFRKYSADIRKRRRDNRARRRLSKRKLHTKHASLVKKKEQKKRKVDSVTVSVRGKFTIYGDIVNLVNLINDLEKQKVKIRDEKIIKIDLSGVTSIDIGAITFLLAKINEMSVDSRIKVWGLLPEDISCKRLIQESGFLQYMTDMNGNRFRKRSANYIIRFGNNTTRNSQVGSEIRKSIKFLTGVEQFYPPVYSIVQEICSNSVEWANPGEDRKKNWLMGINFIKSDDNVYLLFTVTDIGQGILSTLERKFTSSMSDFFKNRSKSDILNNAFDKKYGSKSGEVNRNKGLPLIKDRFSRRYINQLKVITNNVFLDFENQDNSIEMNSSLPGTFYSWKLNLNNIERWKEKN